MKTAVCVSLLEFPLEMICTATCEAAGERVIDAKHDGKTVWKWLQVENEQSFALKRWVRLLCPTQHVTETECFEFHGLVFMKENYLYTDTCSHTHTYTHTYIHTYTHTYTRTHAHTHTHTRAHTHRHSHSYTLCIGLVVLFGLVVCLKSSAFGFQFWLFRDILDQLKSFVYPGSYIFTASFHP